MTIKILRASVAFSEDPWVKVGLYGNTGSGKTDWMARAPMPLVILHEPQGRAVVYASNPDALVVTVTTWEEVEEVMKIVQKAKLIELENSTYGFPHLRAVVDDVTLDFATVCVDGITDLQRLYIKTLLGDKLSSAKPGEEPSLTQNQWGKAIESTERICRVLRNLPCNVIASFLATEAEDDKKVFRVRPTLYGKKLPTSIGQYFNAMGYAYTVEDGDDISYRIAFKASSRYVCKPAPGWPKFITNTHSEGTTTLGSLLNYSYPGVPTAHSEGDDGAIVTSQVEAQEEANNQVQSDTSSDGSDGVTAKGRGRGRGRL